MARFDAGNENRQIQKSDSGGSYPLARQVRQRGLAGQINTLLLQPATFYRTLPPMDLTRQWLWIGMLVLLLIGYSAVRQSENGNSLTGTPSIPPVTDFGDDGGFFGAPPPDAQIPPTGDGGSGEDTSSTWTTFLLAATGVILVWLGQTVLLVEVSLFNGRPPTLGKNFQVAVWASMPLGLMALLQIVYMLTDGMVGEPGVSGLLVESDFYAGQPEFARSLMLALASVLTLPWLWSLALIYFGARHALNGKWWSSLLVVAVWVVVMMVIPVISGDIDASVDDATFDDASEPLDPGLFDFDVAPPVGEEADEGGIPFEDARPLDAPVPDDAFEGAEVTRDAEQSFDSGDGDIEVPREVTPAPEESE